ncbi:MAG: hypothetical protein KDA21_06700, partial [Phycisphaerales bacterium]|nr:hypothetical protein [Phycisphaerales bacterium]
MKHMMFTRLSAAAAIVLACGSVATAVNYDVTGQAGQYAEVVVPTVVRGAGGSFVNATVYVPWIIDADLGPLQNSAVVQTVNGNLLGGVSTFSSDVFPKWVAAVGTTDAASAGQSNNGFVLEGPPNHSNSFGTLLSDGTGVWRANFSSAAPAQNNLEFETLTLANDPAPAVGGASRVFNPASAGIDATPGSVFLGTPAALRDTEGMLLTGVTAFDSFTGNVPSGVCIFSGTLNNPATDADFVWLQTGTPVPAGESDANVRQTQPELAMVTTPLGATQAYVCFGVGISGGAAINGGSTEPIYFAIDRLDANDGYANAAYIESDGDGNLATANNAIKFIDHQATGGGTQPFVNSQFSMNSKGQVAAILRDETAVPNVFSVVVYNPIWNAAQDRIIGYSPAVEVARTGMDTIVPTFTVGAPPSTFTPIAGASIADNGRVAFSAITEVMLSAADDIIYTTSDLFVWDPATDTLHSIVRGGQSGTILSDVFGADGGAIQIGYFSTDIQSDGFNREGFSDDGDKLAVCFRNGIENDAVVDGGVLNPGGAENAVRGVITVDLGDFEVGIENDCNNNGVEDAVDIATGSSSDVDYNGVPDECEVIKTPRCFCDAGSAPCGNSDSAAGCHHSLGYGAELDATGSSSVTSDDLVLVATLAPPLKTGMFLQGATTIQTPFRDGVLCVGNPTERLQFVSTDSGGMAKSTASIVTEGVVSAGQTRQYQYWFRDGMGP